MERYGGTHKPQTMTTSTYIPEPPSIHVPSTCVMASGWFRVVWEWRRRECPPMERKVNCIFWLLPATIHLGPGRHWSMMTSVLFVFGAFLVCSELCGLRLVFFSVSTSALGELSLLPPFFFLWAGIPQTTRERSKETRYVYRFLLFYIPNACASSASFAKPTPKPGACVSPDVHPEVEVSLTCVGLKFMDLCCPDAPEH